MIHIIIVVFVLIIMFALYFMETSNIGEVIKIIMIIAVGAASGAAIYYLLDKTPTCAHEVVCEPEEVVHEKEKWGGIGLAKIAQVNRSNDDTFLKIATDYDVDVQAFYSGNEKVYGQLQNDNSGDSQLALRSRINAEKNKKAVINRSRYTADSVRKYFEDELSANENKVWWDNDELDAYT